MKKTKEKSSDSVAPLRESPELYRAGLSCRIGRDVLEGVARPPEGVSRTDYAIYNLLHAIEDIALALERNKKFLTK